MLADMDRDGDGTISRDEFVAFHSGMSANNAMQLKARLMEKGLPRVEQTGFIPTPMVALADFEPRAEDQMELQAGELVISQASTAENGWLLVARITWQEDMVTWNNFNNGAPFDDSVLGSHVGAFEPFEVHSL